MPSLDNPFRKHTTPPAKDALRALGVDTSGMADAKQTDPAMKLELTEEERARIKAAEASVEAKGNVWNRARLIEWAETFDQDADWVDEMFEIHGKEIVCTQDTLALSNTPVSEIPPGLQVEKLYLRNTQVSEIPPGLQVKELGLGGTLVSEIPPGLQVRVLVLSDTQVSQIPPGLEAEVLYLSNTQVTDIPPGLQVKLLYLRNTQVSVIPEGTAIKKIWCKSDQTALIASAEARGIEVEIVS